VTRSEFTAEVKDMTAGSRSYDDLSDAEQAVSRTEWAERMESARNSMNLAAEFAAAGRSYVELDADGNVIRRDPATTNAS
jgi:hypothetical protein